VVRAWPESGPDIGGGIPDGLRLATIRIPWHEFGRQSFCSLQQLASAAPAGER